MIVVDASLATKWLLREPDSDAALAFLNASAREIVGPDLLRIEVCRALVTAVNMGRIDQPAARAKIAEWLTHVEKGLTLHALDARLVERGTGIALDLGHPLADCLYLALALELDCPLATCDAKFRDRAIGIYPNIKLLADFAAPAPRN